MHLQEFNLIGWIIGGLILITSVVVVIAFVMIINYLETVKLELHSITYKLNKMSNDGDEIKQSLADAKAKIVKVAADVTSLHKKIDALPTAPSAEEIADIKAAAKDLNDSLQVVDDQTPDQ